MTNLSTHSRVDVRTIAPRDRHALILTSFRELPVGAVLELVNDHDPKPLYYQFQAESPGLFSWDYLEMGPEVWRVRIGKLAAAGSKDRCCGHCA